jgi:hypothetical protein
VGVVLALAGGGACATRSAAPGDRHVERSCWPQFPYRDGWLGGDGAYSVPLADGSSLWLFGDTFVGAPGSTDRAGSSFIHNSVGRSTCHADGRFEIEYFWGRGEGGAPRALLDRARLDPDAGADAETGWWWLQGGFVHAGRLYVGLLEVAPSPPHGTLAIPFRVTGTALAVIDDPAGDPRSWRPRVLPLSRGADGFPLAALVVQGTHLYLFGFVDREDGRLPRFLSRLPLSSLDTATPDLPRAIETLGRDGRWLAGLDPAAARIVMEDSATEMSVAFHKPIGKWLALYNYPDVGASFPKSRPSDAVYVRTADALEGPWSAPRLAFRIPELAPGAGDPNTGCYAAKEQSQFSRPGSATFTYVCNLFTGPGEDPFAVLRRLQRQMQLYRPIPVTVTLPESAPSARPVQ